MNKFQEAVRENRKKLKEAGYAPSVIHSWEHGTLPQHKTAMDLMVILNLPWDDVVYFRIEKKEVK